VTSRASAPLEAGLGSSVCTKTVANFPSKLASSSETEEGTLVFECDPAISPSANKPRKRCGRARSNLRDVIDPSVSGVTGRPDGSNDFVNPGWHKSPGYPADIQAPVGNTLPLTDPRPPRGKVVDPQWRPSSRFEMSSLRRASDGKPLVSASLPAACVNDEGKSSMVRNRNRPRRLNCAQEALRRSEGYLGRSTKADVSGSWAYT